MCHFFGCRCYPCSFVAVVNANVSEWLHSETLRLFLSLSCLLHVATLIVMFKFVTLKILGEEWRVNCLVSCPRTSFMSHHFNTCTVHLLLFCTMTNKCTIISQIITLLHVSTLSCHPQTACNQYLAKLHKYFKCSCW